MGQGSPAYNRGGKRVNPALLRGGGGGGGFSPTDLPNLAVWLDAISSPMTVDGSNRVSQWNDLSGNVNHATWGILAGQPTYSATVFNSLPGVDFSAGTKSLVFTAAIAAGAKSIYLGISGGNADNGILGLAGGFSGLITYNNPPYLFQWYKNGFKAWTQATQAPNALTLITDDANSSSGKAMYQNGSALTELLGNTGWGVDFDTIGNNGANTSYPRFVGKLAWLVVYTEAHDATTQAQVETYFRNKWSI